MPSLVPPWPTRGQEITRRLRVTYTQRKSSIFLNLTRFQYISDIAGCLDEVVLGTFLVPVPSHNYRVSRSCCLWSLPGWLRKCSYGLLFCCRLHVGCYDGSIRTCFYNCVQHGVRNMSGSMCYRVARTDIVRIVKLGRLSSEDL